jgi:hypothetical protein
MRVSPNRLVAVLFALLAVLPGLAAADAASDLRDSAVAIIRADQQRRGDRGSAVNLDREVQVLTSLIESGQLNSGGQAIARYWRGRAYTTLNWARMDAGKGADAGWARTSLADFDSVIAFGRDIPEWRIAIPDTLYFAGGVARNHLEDASSAYRYWQKCADLGHAGCLNTMATARLTGAGGTKVDLHEAIELNRRVYDTGTDYRCAGAYSAFEIALILYFSDISPVTVDRYQWLARGYQLLDELGAHEKSDNPCNRAKFEISEYLMRLGQKEERGELLRTAAGRKAENDYAPLAQYLAGAVSAQAFREVVAKTALKHVACEMNFAAAWHADLRRDAALSREYRDALAAFGGDHCAPQIALLGLRKAKE